MDSSRRAYRALKQEFQGIGQLSQAHLASAIGHIEQAADGGNVVVFIMLAPDQGSDPQTGAWTARSAEKRLNGWIRSAVVNKPDFHLVDMLDFVEYGTELPEDFHFSRLVYKRTAEHIRTIIEARFGLAAKREGELD